MGKEGKRKHKNAMQLSLMLALSLAAQALSLYKSHFTAVSFGATSGMDAYNYAFSLATFLFGFMTNGVTTVIIPAYVRKDRREITDSFITAIYGAVLTAAALILVLRFPFLRLLTSNSEDFVRNTGNWLFITFFIQGITAFIGVTTAYFQCVDHFLTPKVILLLVNGGVTAAMLAGLVTNLHRFLLLQAAASVVNLIFDVSVCMALGFRYRPRFLWKDPETKKLLRLFLPVMLSSGIYKLSTFVDTTIASGLSEGRLTVLNYATHVVTMVNTIVVGNLTVYIYPKIVRQLEKEDHKKRFWDYEILFHAIVMLIVAAFFTVGRECLSIIFSGGKFTDANLVLLNRLAAVYIFGQQLSILRDLIYRYFFASGDTRRPVQNSILVSVTNIIVSIILVQFVGVYGIVLGTVIASLVSFVRIVFVMKKKYGLGIKFTGFLLELGKTEMSFLAATGAVLLLRQYLSFGSRLVTICVFGPITGVLFVGCLFVLRSKVFRVRLG